MRAVLAGWLFGVLLIGCATPVPSPSMSSSLVTSTRPKPTAAPTLNVGGIAAAVGVIHLQTAAGADPSPGEPDAGNLEAGSIAYIIAGPDRRAGLDWWHVQSERSFDVGWAASTQDGTPVLVALDPDCPPIATLTVEQVIGIGRVRGLVCFGDAQLTFDANVFCVSAAIDGGAGGASWMDSYRLCQTVGDPAMALFGQAITSTLGADLAANPVTARFRITGHFDDPEASRCWNVPVGVNLDAPGEPDPEAVIACRERFVVTQALRLE
jgi:hypothetical protein